MIPIQWKQNDKKTMHVNEAENGVVYLTWPAIEKIVLIYVLPKYIQR